MYLGERYKAMYIIENNEYTILDEATDAKSQKKWRMCFQHCQQLRSLTGCAFVVRPDSVVRPVSVKPLCTKPDRERYNTLKV